MDLAGIEAQFESLVASFDVRDLDSLSQLPPVLDDLSRELALSLDLRQVLGRVPSAWALVRKLWKDLGRAHFSFWESDDDDTLTVDHREESLRNFCLSLARMTRNLVAGVPENQQQAFENEPLIRQLLHYYTSWSSLKEQQSVQLARMLTQTLSNLVTGNEPLLHTLWETYMHLPEDRAILIRLLNSSEPLLIMPTLVLMTNVLNRNRDRLKLLCRTTTGLRTLVCLLDDMVLLFEEEEGTDGAQAFDCGYAIFSMIVEEHLVQDVYCNLSMEGEIITPQQTVLFKLLDSYLQSTQVVDDQSTEERREQVNRKLSPMLARCFFSLAHYAQAALRRSLSMSPLSSVNSHRSNSSSSSSSNQSRHQRRNQSTSGLSSVGELDVMLPKVCEALVLVSQCMASTALWGENHLPLVTTSPLSPKLDPKTYFNEARQKHEGVVESLIGTLGLLDQFLPRINFGRPVASPTSHPGSTTSMEGFQYVKRDLVRLLGILVHQNRGAQDRVRELGGLQVVMNMCVIDDRNPYLREHAIFTLRNLLEDNFENQNIVHSTQPAIDPSATMTHVGS